MGAYASLLCRQWVPARRRWRPLSRSGLDVINLLRGTSGGSPHWTVEAHGAWPRLLAVAARSTTLCGGCRVAGLHRLDDGIHDLHGYVGLGTAGVRLAWRPVWSASGCAPRRRLADRLDRRRP